MLNLLTIVLDGMPWIEKHLQEFDKLDALNIPWRWNIVHGASMNGGSTRWCKPQAFRLSQDGTTEYLRSIRPHPNVRIYESSRWDSKDAMVNAPLGDMPEGILMQIDSDELWTAENLKRVLDLFTAYPHAQRAYFCCDYYVGPNIITIGENCYGANPGEWLRAWRFSPGMKFNSHEPPVLSRNLGDGIGKFQSLNEFGIRFKHMAYATEKQVAFKELFYGYKGAVKQWKRLQEYKGPWPVKLKDFLPWVDDRVRARKILL